MPEKFQQFNPKERESNHEKDKTKSSRRDFLKQAGKFLGGAAVAGSIFEKISKGIADADVTKKLGMENRDRREDEKFDMEALKAELAGLKKQFPNTWRTEADARANAGIELLIVALSEERGVDRTKIATGAGFGIGLVGGAVRELARSDGNMIKGTRKEIEDKIVGLINNIAVAAAVGGVLGMGGGKLAEYANSENPDKRDLAFKEISEKLSSATLRRIGADGKDTDNEFEGLEQFIGGQISAYERFMIDGAKLRSHIAKWGAGSYFTARELWDKSSAFRELIGREKQ